MTTNREEKRIQREIIRRAFEKVRADHKEEERLRRRRDTLEALREMTGLEPLELERIADGVMTSRDSTGAGFFSVKNQILLTAGMVCVPLGIPVFLVWLI